MHAGETVLWAAVPSIPPTLEAPAAPPRTCADVSPGDSAACLQRTAKGEGLEAEVALFELGRFQARAGQADAAVRSWRSSLTRFPAGIFGPEVRLALVVTLTQQRRFSDALTVAREFEVAYADDPRREDVVALRRQLEWLARQR